MKVTVPSYGLHWISGGIGLLVQEIGTSDITGVDLHLEVAVDQKLLPPCPHAIDLEARLNEPLPDHLLIATSLPVPKEIKSPVYVHDTIENRTKVKSLMRLSSSDQAFPFWSLTEKQIHKQLALTNLTPLLMYDYRKQWQSRLDSLQEMVLMYQRPVIVMGDRWVLPGVPKEKLDFEISHLPLEKIGAHHIYERMNNG